MATAQCPARLALETATSAFLEIGNPAEQITKAVKSRSPDLIVVGGHGRSGVKRVLLDGVAEAVTRHLPCPALIVRTRD